MDEAELLKFCEKYNNLIWKNSKQGDYRLYKFINVDGKLSSVWISIDKHIRRQRAIRIDNNLMEQLLEDNLTDEDK